MNQPKIIISGAGMGGLMLANLLLKDGIEVCIIEQSTELRNIGFGVVIHATGRSILRYCGLKEAFLKKAAELSRYKNFSMRGSVLGKLSFVGMPQYKPYIILRSDLQNILAAAIPEKSFIFGKRVTSINEEGNTFKVELSDGSYEEADLIVGADGVHSMIRHYVAPDFIPKNSSHHAWLAWSKNPVGTGEVLQCWKPHKIFASFPFSDTECFVMFATDLPFTKDDDENAKDFLRKHFADLNSIVDQTIADIPESKEVYHTSLTDYAVYPFIRNRAVLVGDAQHASFPYAGLGVSAAFEDVFVLYKALRRYEYGNIDRALRDYRTDREKRTKQLKGMTSLANAFGDVKPFFGTWLREIGYAVIPSRLLETWLLNKLVRYLNSGPVIED